MIRIVKKRKNNNKSDPIAVIVLVFIAWYVIKTLNGIYPDFAEWGLALFVAFAGGAVWYLKRQYWK